MIDTIYIKEGAQNHVKTPKMLKRFLYVEIQDSLRA